jgi:hypothetical protein
MNAYAFQLYDLKDDKRFKKIVILKMVTFLTDLAGGIPVKCEEY